MLPKFKIKVFFASGAQETCRNNDPVATRVFLRIGASKGCIILKSCGPQP